MEYEREKRNRVAADMDKYETMIFGTYPQGKNGTVSPIKWLVIPQKPSKSSKSSRKLISKYVLDCCSNGADVRNWLNTEFLQQAFTSDEKEQLRQIQHGHRVTLVGDTELPSSFPYACIPTQYAVERGVYESVFNDVNGKAACWWWMRANKVCNSDGTMGSCSEQNEGVGVRPVIVIRVGEDPDHSSEL